MGDTLNRTAGGAASGAATGAGIGSFVGPWGTAIGGVAGGVLGGLGGYFSGQNSPQQVSGLTDEQIAALGAATRARGISAMKLATRAGLRGTAGGAAGRGTMRSGLLQRDYQNVTGQAAGRMADLEAQIAAQAAQLYAGRQWAPPQPTTMEKISGPLAGLGGQMLMANSGKWGANSGTSGGWNTRQALPEESPYGRSILSYLPPKA
jgi:hypothetical protein